MIIAIDGPAGAGKSTTARMLAQRLGFSYIDTGAMYRAVALACWERGMQVEDDTPEIVMLANSLAIRLGQGENGVRVFLGTREVSDEIRAPHIADFTSQISAIPAVRSAIVETQRRLGREAEENSGGAVFEGRDIQTVVFPDAEVKIFLDAEPRTRAQRRTDEITARGEAADLDETERGLRERDARDTEREASPLKPGEDAVILFSDGKTPEQVVDEIAALVEAARK
jgi:cytidylate kinase